MIFPRQEIVDKIKEQYPSGTRVRLVRMEDPFRHIPEGTEGTVDCVDDTGTIHVAWDTGNHLGIVYGEDACEKVEK
jgi:hypothetical protein